MRLNTLFSTLFDRRTGVGLRSMSNGVELDGKTKLSSVLQEQVLLSNHKMIIETPQQIQKSCKLIT